VSTEAGDLGVSCKLKTRVRLALRRTSVSLSHRRHRNHRFVDGH
jgi:hypothetical protein